MNVKRNGKARGQKSKSIQGEGPNWVLIAGGALMSTLFVRLGFKLKHALDSKQQAYATGNGITDKRRTPSPHLYMDMHPNIDVDDDDDCFNRIPVSEASAEIKHPSNNQTTSESDSPLPLATVTALELNKDNGVIWSANLPCGSDIFNKREVMQKLRQQLKRRDDMILEMQDQILELQNSLDAQRAHSMQLQSQLEASNRDLFDSERQIQRLRKAIADHCVGHVAVTENTTNGYVNGYVGGESNYK